MTKNNPTNKKAYKKTKINLDLNKKNEKVNKSIQIADVRKLNKKYLYILMIVVFVTVLSVISFAYNQKLDHISVNLKEVDMGKSLDMNIEENIAPELGNNEDTSEDSSDNKASKQPEANEELIDNVNTSKNLKESSVSKTESTKVSTMPKAPADNKEPEVRILSYGLEGFNHDVDKGVQIAVKANDPDGYISKVEIYIDGNKKATVTPSSIGGVDAPLTNNADESSEVIKEVGEWLTDNIDESVGGYVFYDEKTWSDPTKSCGISEGYAIFYATERYYYDVRRQDDSDKTVICHKTDVINARDIYYYLWQPKSGEHDTYAIAYDQYGTPRKSDKIKFKVD
jgi:hypothetical protein